MELLEVDVELRSWHNSDGTEIRADVELRIVRERVLGLF